MERRDFLKLAGATGLAVGSASLYSRARANFGNDSKPVQQTYTGPLFAFFQAVGGWDPVQLCDPKGNYANQSFGEGDILTVGDIRYAPIPGATEFFTAHAPYMTVVNGVDVQTNSHEAGRRHMASGRLAEGYPNLAALVAGASAANLPMAFLTFGGYEITGTTVPPVRDGNQARLTELAYPDQTNPGNMEDPQYYMSDAAREMIAAAKEERLHALQQGQKLPRFHRAQDMLITANESSDQLKLLDEILPEPDPDPEFRRIQLAVAAYAAGVGAAVNFAMGGFDTHSNHDAQHIPRLTTMMSRVNFLFEEAERQGVADQVVATMSSDFGRTPNYNGGNGKDHWQISSMIVMGKDIPGNRTVGMTDMDHNSIAINPDTFDEAEDPSQGVIPEPAHVHKSLRKKFGVEGTIVDQIYPLTTDKELDIFG